MRRAMVVFVGAVAALIPGAADPMCVVRQSVETLTLEVESVTLDDQPVTDALPSGTFSVTALPDPDSGIEAQLYDPERPQTTLQLILARQP